MPGNKIKLHIYTDVNTIKESITIKERTRFW